MFNAVMWSSIYLDKVVLSICVTM